MPLSLSIREISLSVSLKWVKSTTDTSLSFLRSFAISSRTALNLVAGENWRRFRTSSGIWSK